VVERVLALGRPRREHEQLARQLAAANEALERRGRELTILFALGRAVTSVTDQVALLGKIIEGAAYLGEADTGYLLLRQEGSKIFLLSAQYNLPAPAAGGIGQPWEDGLGPLVALSGESLSIQGEPLGRYQTLYRLGRSALVVPIKMKREVFGLITLLRKTSRSFSPGSQALVEAVADIASISLINLRLFRALDERGQAVYGQAQGHLRQDD
jgi:GAF domain-containing protein